MPVESDSDGPLAYITYEPGSIPDPAQGCPAPPLCVEWGVESGAGYNGHRFVASGDSFSDYIEVDILSGFHYTWFSQAACLGKLPFGGLDRDQSRAGIVQFTPGKTGPPFSPLATVSRTGHLPISKDTGTGGTYFTISDALESGDGNACNGCASLEDWWNNYGGFVFTSCFNNAPDEFMFGPQRKGRYLRAVPYWTRVIPGCH